MKYFMSFKFYTLRATHSLRAAVEDGPVLFPGLSQLVSVPPGSPPADTPRNAAALPAVAWELICH